jgi:hypothetical protein
MGFADLPRCTTKGCDSYASLKGVCRKHYDQTYSATSDGVHLGGAPKLTDADVAKVRRLKAALRTQREIAIEMGVSRPTVAKVLSGEYVTVEQKAATS